MCDFASTLRGGNISSLEIVFQIFKMREGGRKPLTFTVEVSRIKFYYKESINFWVLCCDSRMSFQGHDKDLVFLHTRYKKIIHIDADFLYSENTHGHTLMAEKSRATPDWVQSFPTKGMN